VYTDANIVMGAESADFFFDWTVGVRIHGWQGNRKIIYTGCEARRIQ
jgi:hypothetical protein